MHKNGVELVTDPALDLTPNLTHSLHCIAFCICVLYYCVFRILYFVCTSNLTPTLTHSLHFLYYIAAYCTVLQFVFVLYIIVYFVFCILCLYVYIKSGTKSHSFFALSGLYIAAYYTVLHFVFVFYVVYFVFECVHRI